MDSWPRVRADWQDDHMTDTTKEIRIAAAIITDDLGRLLLVRKAGTDAFMQPGGKIEPGEPVSSALAREVREELQTEVITSEHIGTFEAPAANEPGHTVVAELFRTIIQGIPEPAAEIAQMIWLEPSDIGERTIAPLSRLILEQHVSNPA